MTCRTACLTQDHESYGACCRASGVHASRVDVTREKRWQQELAEYRTARAYGAQPASTRLADTRLALDASDRLGRPYDATRALIGG